MSDELDDFLDGPTDEELSELERERAKHAASYAELRRRVTSLTKALHGVESTLALAIELNRHVVSLPDIPVIAHSSKAKPEATAIALLSDTHAGEKVLPALVSFRNEYKPAIYTDRSWRWLHGLKTMIDSARSAWHVPRLLLGLLGDLMTGYIHEEYIEENYLSPGEEQVLVFETLVHLIDEMLRSFDLEDIFCVCTMGNHGRTGKIPKIASDWKNNYEHTLYSLLALHYKDEPRVRFHIEKGYNAIIPVYGRNCRFHHGHRIKYRGGVGGLMVPTYGRLARQAMSDDNQNIFWDFFGHHHSYGCPRKAGTNGSLIGWTNYADAQGFPLEDPMQWFGVLDSKYGVLSHCSPILVK